MLNFFTEIENVGKHTLSGVEKVAPIVAKFGAPVSLIPVVGPILCEVASVITSLEETGNNLTSDELATIIQTIAAAAHLKTSAAVIANNTKSN